MFKKLSYKKLFFATIIFALSSLVFGISFLEQTNLRAGTGAIRGTSGDLWADIVLGKRDFGEVTNKLVKPYLAEGGGVVVDNTTNIGKAYIWDTAHSRILGMDLADCYALPADGYCTADLVIGQPSGTDWGSCNQDASFQYYPDKSPSSASTLCSIPEWTHTVLEDKSHTSMYVDSNGNLFVYDTINNRVLEYYDPYGTDTVADQVWGQPDFASNNCNLTSVYKQIPVQPTDSSLCYIAIGGIGGGVTLDPDGNLWVADGGNNRVLRFTKDIGTGEIAKNADLVLGQANFTTGGDWSYSSDINRMYGPTALRFGSDGSLYVFDSGNSRITRFDAPFTNGMDASAVILDSSDFPESPLYFEMDPNGNFFWTGELDGPNTTFKKWNLAGVDQNISFQNWQQAGGSIGFDLAGNVIVPTEDVVQYINNGDDTYTEGKIFFHMWLGTGEQSFNRLSQGGWGGMEVTSTSQLIVTDNRLLFWNDPMNATNGLAPDGYAGAPDEFTESNYLETTIDASDKLYVQVNPNTIKVFQAPLTTGEAATQTITGPFNVLGGGQISVGFISGMAVSPDSNYLWIDDVNNNRAIRIRNPLTSPVVDVVLGQTDITSNSCNRGLLSATDPNATANMICQAGSLEFDRQGNLYLSDTFFEITGNWRLLMFAAGSIPDNPGSVVFAPSATKIFPLGDFTHAFHTTLTPAFDSLNRMVVGYNPYAGTRFLDYYINPTGFNPSNPADPDFAIPDGSFNDFYGWAFTTTFDSQDNLYVYDTNRGKIMIYEQPLALLPTPTPSVTPTPSATPSPTVTPSPTPSVTPTPTPTTTPVVVPTPTPLYYSNPTPTITPTVKPSSKPTVSPAKNISYPVSSTVSYVPQENSAQEYSFINSFPIIKLQPQLPLVIGTILAALVTLGLIIGTVIGSGYNILEILGLYFFLFFGKNKKRNGTIYDQFTGKPVSFAVVQLIQKDSQENRLSEEKIIESTLTDTNGQYNLTTPPIGTYLIEVNSNSYKSYANNLDVVNNQSIALDIFLTPLLESQQSLVQKVFSHKSALFNTARLVILLTSVLGFAVTVYAQITTPNNIHLLLLALYTILFVSLIYPLSKKIGQNYE